jgi:hypothetical protein
VEQLDGDRQMNRGVFRFEHNPHPTFTEHVPDQVFTPDEQAVPFTAAVFGTLVFRHCAHLCVSAVGLFAFSAFGPSYPHAPSMADKLILYYGKTP